MIEISQIIPAKHNTSDGDLISKRKLDFTGASSQDGSEFSNLVQNPIAIDEFDIVHIYEDTEPSPNNLDELFDTTIEDDEISTQIEKATDATPLNFSDEKLRPSIQHEQEETPEDSALHREFVAKPAINDTISEIEIGALGRHQSQVEKNATPTNEVVKPNLPTVNNQVTSKIIETNFITKNFNQQSQEVEITNASEVFENKKIPKYLSIADGRTHIAQSKLPATERQYRNTKSHDVLQNQNAIVKPNETSREATASLEQISNARPLNISNSSASLQENTPIDSRVIQHAYEGPQKPQQITFQSADRVQIASKPKVQSEQWQTLTEKVSDFDQRNVPDHARQIEPTARLNSGSAIPQTSTTPPQGQSEARFIAQQLGVQLSNQKEKTTTIRLTPEDLGHVRMTLRTNDTGLSLAIFADRPETAEFMRRNIEILAQEFQSLGFENLSFQFDGDAPNQNANAKIDAVPSDESDTIEKPDLARTQLNSSDGRLDIRI